MQKESYPTQEQWTQEAFDFLTDLKQLFSLAASKKETSDLKSRLEHLLQEFETVQELKKEERYLIESQLNFIDPSAYHDLSTL